MPGTARQGRGGAAPTGTRGVSRGMTSRSASPCRMVSTGSARAAARWRRPGSMTSGSAITSGARARSARARHASIWLSSPSIPVKTASAFVSENGEGNWRGTMAGAERRPLDDLACIDAP